MGMGRWLLDKLHRTALSQQLGAPCATSAPLHAGAGSVLDVRGGGAGQGSEFEYDCPAAVRTCHDIQRFKSD